MKYRNSWFAAVAVMAFAATGCSMDTAPDIPAASDVRPYYVKLATPNIQYRFTEVATAEYHPQSGELVMNMQGLSSRVYDNKPVYTCMWSYPGFADATPWYYTLDEHQAVDLGVDFNGYTDSWVDLQAPLQQDATWTFVSMGETITAKITKFGATAKVRGVTYTDVLMVQYTGNNGTNVTEWFAKDKGLIYSNYSRPNIGSVVNELESIEQK